MNKFIIAKSSIFKQSLFLLTTLISFTNCDDSAENENNISGIVVDAQTNEPIAGATVKILENGPETVTNENGVFAFSEQAIIEAEQITQYDQLTMALSISHIDFRPRETNVIIGQQVELELGPIDYPSFFYHKPVQLDDDIETGALDEVDMNYQSIQNLMDKIYRDNYDEVHSVLIYRSGKLILEEYFHGNNDTIDFENGVIVDDQPPHIQWGRNDKHYVASTNKAFTSIITGIALDQHDVPIETAIAGFLPEYNNYFDDEGKANISFKDCLSMQANLQWNEWGHPDLINMWKSTDFAEFLLSRPYLGAGTEWRYNSALPNLVLKCVDNMVGGNVREWAHENFYGKLGITDYEWQNQPDGYPEGSARMFIRPRDMLKIGITYLDQGQWKGEQVIPEDYVRACFDHQVTTPDTGDYSYYFWLRNLNGVDYLSAEGDGGNFINIIPSLDLVIVVTQGLYLKHGKYSIQMKEMMEDYILPAAE
ncbi:MAG: serine hydrolase [Reichenbachiella sp.]